MDRALDGSLGSSFDGGPGGFDGMVADGRAMRVRAVLELPGMNGHGGPERALPVVEISDGTAAIVAGLASYGS